jgi:SAM-dependent methyltransferase
VRLAVSELETFYDSPLGRLASTCISHKLWQAWDRGAKLRIAAFGYGQPYLGRFDAAERRSVLVPEGMGVRAGGAVPACLVEDSAWPLRDASLDRLLIVHGLEEIADPRRLLREAWRVLADDGLIIIVVANRRGPWALVETSPFAAGRPYSRRQLDQVLAESMFAPTAHATALHFPPVPNRGFLRLARLWERLGETVESWRLPKVFPNLAGVNLVEARKSTAVPIGGSKAEVFRPSILVPNGLRPATLGAEPCRDRPVSARRDGGRPGRQDQ